MLSHLPLVSHVCIYVGTEESREGKGVWILCVFHNEQHFAFASGLDICV